MVILDVIPDYAWSGFKPMKQDSGCPGKVILNVIPDDSWSSFKLRVSTYGSKLQAADERDYWMFRL